MDNLLTGDSSLMDGGSDLPLLPLLLLPLPEYCILPPRPVDGSSPANTDPPVVSVSADLSREGPFEVLPGASDVWEVPMVLNNLPGCPYRMTSYDRAEVTDVDPAYGLQLHHPRFLKYVGAPKSAHLLTRPPGHWVQTMEREEAVTAALQLQHDANRQVLGQFVTSLNRMSSEVMRFAFGQEVFPSVAVQAISPSIQVHRVAHYMAAMGLWCPVARVLPCLRRFRHATII